MSKKTVSIRLSPNLFEKLQTLSELTGRNRTELVGEAIAQYLREDIQTVGDRLSRLERDLAVLRERSPALFR